MIVTIRRLDVSRTTHLEVPDEHCMALLDKFAREFQLPNPAADARLDAVLAAREVAKLAPVNLRRGKR